MPSRSRARPPRVAHLPLHMRLPNAPPVFVGRTREADALEAAIRSGPVATVWGVGGLGKSTLAFHVLHTRFPAQVERTLLVRLARDEAIEHALLALAKTLAEMQGATDAHWHSLLADRDALLATVIDLADGPPRRRDRDTQAHWIVIDDVHHAEPTRAADVVAQLARYARRSRWILVSRSKIVPDGALSQAVALGAMNTDELQTLGQRWGLPELLDDRVVASAAGSPWRLAQLLSGAQPRLEPGEAGLLEGLPVEVAGFLNDLSLIEVELSEETLGRFTRLPPPQTLAALELRGLIERRPRGVRLHDVARGLVDAGQHASAMRGRKLEAARVLCDSADPAAWLEGMRLFVQQGEPAAAAAELDAKGEAQLEAGQVLAMWRVLEQTTAPELASWRLHCATEIGDVSVLRGVAMPPSPCPADRFRWALSLLLQGRHEEASVAGAEAQRSAVAAGDDRLAYEAGRLVGRANANRSLYAQALDAFRTCKPVTPRQTMQHHVDIATCLAGLARRDEALAHFREVEDRLLEQPEIGDSELRLTVTTVLYQCGALPRAEQAAERLLKPAGPFWGHDARSIRSLFLSSTIALDRGAVNEAARFTEKFSPLAFRSHAYSIYATMIRILVRLASGSLDGLRDDIFAFMDAATKTGRDDIVCSARWLRSKLAIALGEHPEGPPLELRPNDTAFREVAVFWEAIHRAHWGGETALPSEVPADAPPLQALWRVSRAWVALGTGQASTGIVIAQEAVIIASASGYGSLEALAREVIAVGEILAAAPAASVTKSATALAAFATTNGMTPLAVLGELLALLASTESFDPTRLEGIAAHPAAPVAARRARALLGDDVALDTIDRAFVSAAHRRLGLRIVAVRTGESSDGHAAGWGLDERTQAVWLPGRFCSFAERPLLWRMLGVIARDGGAADKEALVTGAWEQRDYHPLRDDARLHTAVRTLRRLIEDDPTHPARVVTTGAGYAFGRAAPVRRLVVEQSHPREGTAA